MHIHIARIVGIQIKTTTYIYIYILYQLHTLWQFLPTQYQHFPPRVKRNQSLASNMPTSTFEKSRRTKEPSKWKSESNSESHSASLFCLAWNHRSFFFKISVGEGGSLKYHRNSLVLFCFVWWRKIHVDCWMLSCCWNLTWIWSDFWATECTDVFFIRTINDDPEWRWGSWWNYCPFILVIHPQFMLGCNAGPPPVKLESLNDASC